jgi:hypothetical protein
VSKVITSPSKRWPGSVTLADPLTLPQVELIEAALRPLDNVPEDGQVYLTALDKPQIPAILACVEKWDLQDFPVPTLDTFPMSPRRETHDLIAWIFREMRRVYIGDQEIPNE